MFVGMFDLPSTKPWVMNIWEKLDPQFAQLVKNMVQISGFVFILDATSWPVEMPMVAKITPRHIFKTFLPMQFRSVQCQMSKEFTRLHRQDIYQYLICPEMQACSKVFKNDTNYHYFHLSIFFKTKQIGTTIIKSCCHVAIYFKRSYYS